jgi:hypothetical protein
LVPSAIHFLLAQKKVTPEFPFARRGRQKGHLAANAPQAQGGQRTTTFTIDSLMHYDYSLSLSVQLV